MRRRGDGLQTSAIDLFCSTYCSISEIHCYLAVRKVVTVPFLCNMSLIALRGASESSRASFAGPGKEKFLKPANFRATDFFISLLKKNGL